MALEYVVYYRGNLAAGFDYIYAKQTDQHAFYLRVPAEMKTFADITDATFDFSRTNADEVQADDKRRPFASMWQDVSFQWPNIERRLMEILPTWQPEYRGVVTGKTDEWGVRIKFADQPDELRFVGYNDFPADFELFEKWIKSYEGGRLR